MHPTLPLDLPAPAILPDPVRTGARTGERVPEAEQQRIRELYAKQQSIAAIAKATGHSRDTITAICDPSRLHQALTPDQVQRIRNMHTTGAPFKTIAAETGIPLTRIHAVIAAQSEAVQALQQSRGPRAVVAEAIAMEATLEAIQRRTDEGKLTVAESANLLMILNGMSRDTIGAAPIRVRLEADEGVLAAAAIFGGTRRSHPTQTGPIIDADTSTPAPAQDQLLPIQEELTEAP